MKKRRNIISLLALIPVLFCSCSITNNPVLKFNFDAFDYEVPGVNSKNYSELWTNSNPLGYKTITYLFDYSKAEEKYTLVYLNNSSLTKYKNLFKNEKNGYEQTPGKKNEYEIK